MDETNYRVQVFKLEKEIERCEKIKCHRVADKFRRQLEKLKQEYEQSKDNKK